MLGKVTTKDGTVCPFEIVKFHHETYSGLCTITKDGILYLSNDGFDTYKGTKYSTHQANWLMEKGEPLGLPDNWKPKCSSGGSADDPYDN